jgi:hypothetical protein
MGDGRDDADRLLKASRAGHDAIYDGAEVEPPPASARAEEEVAPLMAKAAAQTQKR